MRARRPSCGSRRRAGRPAFALRRAAAAAPLARAKPDGQVRHLPIGVRHERRPIAVERVVDNALARPGAGPRVGAQLVEAEARGRLQRAVARVVLEEQRTGAAGDVERVLVQLRQQVDEPRRWASSEISGRTAAAGRAVGHRGHDRLGRRVSRRDGESRDICRIRTAGGPQGAGLYRDLSSAANCRGARLPPGVDVSSR